MIRELQCFPEDAFVRSSLFLPLLKGPSDPFKVSLPVCRRVIFLSAESTLFLFACFASTVILAAFWRCTLLGRSSRLCCSHGCSGLELLRKAKWVT